MSYRFYNNEGGGTSQIQNNAIDRALAVARNPMIANDPQLYRLFNENTERLENGGMAMIDATGRAELGSLAEEYRSRGIDGRRLMYEGLDENTRDSLTRHYGIDPPDLEGQGGIGGLMSLVGKGVAAPFKLGSAVLEPFVGAVPEPIRNAGKDVRGTILDGGGLLLKALDVAGDQPAHLYRSVHKVFDDMGWDLNNPLVAAAVLGVGIGTGGLAIAGLGALGTGAALGAFGAMTAGTLGGTLGVASVGIGAAAVGGNPMRMWDAFMATHDGDQYFRRDALEAASEILSGDKDLMALVKELAAGGSVEDFADDQFDVGTPGYQEFVQELTVEIGTEEFKDAMAELKMGQVSPGRWLAEAFTPFDRGSTAYSMISGAIDATYLVAADPTLLLGRSAKAARLARFGFREGDLAIRLRQMWDPLVEGSTALRRGRLLGLGPKGSTNREQLELSWKQIAEGMNQEIPGATAQLTKLMPATIPLIAPMRQYEKRTGKLIKTADDVFDFFMDSDGIESLLRGKAAVRRGWLEAPHMTAFGLKKAKGRRWFGEAIEFGADPDQQKAGEHLIDLIQADDMWLPKLGIEDVPQDISKANLQRLIDDGTIDLSQFEGDGIGFMRRHYEGSMMAKFVFGDFGHVKFKARGRMVDINLNPIQAGSKLIKGLTTQVPFNRAVIDLYGTEGTQDMINLVEMGGMMAHLPNTVKNVWIDFFLNSDDAARRIGVKTFLYTTMKRAGIGGDEVTEAYSNEFVRKLDQMFSTFREANLMSMGNEGTMASSAAILPHADFAAQLRIPLMRDMLGVSRKFSLTRRLWGHANPKMLYKGMDMVWKPSVLLRIGFIPRAAGEELLNTIMRHPSAFATSKLNRFAADEIGYDEAGRLDGTGLLPVAKKIAQVRRGRKPKEITRVVDGVETTYIPPATGRRRYQTAYNWSEDAQRATDIHNIRKMVGEGHARRLFADRDTPIIEEILVRTTQAARHAVRAMAEQGRLGIDEFSVIATRSLLSLEDKTDRFAKLNAIDSQVAGIMGRNSEFDFDVIQSFLQADKAQAQAMVNGAMSMNSMAGEALAKTNDALIPGINSPNQDVGGALVQDGVGMLVPMKGIWQTLNTGDPMFQYAYYGAVTRMLKKDKIGNTLGEMAQLYVNPKVRKELAESGLMDGDYIDFIANLNHSSNLHGEEFNYLLRRYLSDFSGENGLYRSELLKEAHDRGLSIMASDLTTGLAPSPTDIARWLDDLRDLSSEAKGTLIGLLGYKKLDRKSFFHTVAERNDALTDTARQMLNSPDFAKKVRTHERYARGSRSGLPVVKGVEDGKSRMYMPLMNRPEIDLFLDHSVALADRALKMLFDKGWDRRTLESLKILGQRGFQFEESPNVGMALDDLRQVIRGKVPPEQGPSIGLGTRDLYRSAVKANQDNLVQDFIPVGGLGFSDHKTAQKFANDFSEVLAELTAGGRSSGRGRSHVGYIDMLETEIRTTVNPNEYPWVGAQRYGSRTPQGAQVESFRINPHSYGDVEMLGIDMPLHTRIENGVKVSVQGITQEQAIDEWAEVAVERFNEVFQAADGSGDMIPQLLGPNYLLDAGADEVYNDSFFAAHHIQGIDPEKLPKNINAPKWGPEEKKGLWNKAVQYGFGRIITPAIDSIARQPLYTMEYISAARATMGSRLRLRDSTLQEALTAMPSKVLHGTERGHRIDFSRLNTDDIEHINVMMKDEKFRAMLTKRLKAKPLKRDPKTGRMLKNSGFHPSETLSSPHKGFYETWEDAHETLMDMAKGTDASADLARSVLPIYDDLAKMADTQITEEAFLNMYRKSIGEKVESYDEFRKILYEHDGSIPWQLNSMSKSDWRLMEDMHREDWGILQQMNVIASERAFRAVIPFIDDNRLRSQFQEWTHNYIPFHFAEEQFIKRWARTIIDSPESIRRMQLLYNGMKSSGMIIEDPVTSDKIFVMPFSAAASDVIGRVSEKVFGHKARLPISMPLTGQVLYTVPGLDSLGVPSVAPTMAIPVGLLAGRLPELKLLQKFEGAITGNRGSRRPIYDQIFPASIRRFAEATVLWDPDGAKHAAHMMAAIQYLDMNDLTPDDDASALEHQEYLEMVREWTRTLAMVEAIYGFIAPASPQSGNIITGSDPYDVQANIGLSVDELNEIPRPRFLELMRTGMGWDEAVSAFIKEEPRATAYTVFATQGTTGRVLPQDSPTLEFMVANKALFRSHTEVAAWLIPHSTRTDTSDWKAYNEQLAVGIRTNKEVEEFYENIHFVAAAPQWQEIKDFHDTEIERIKGLPQPARQRPRLEENDRWRQESRQFIAMHPLWAETYQSGQGRFRRQGIIDQWEDLAQNPEYVRTDRFNDLNGLMELYRVYKAQRDQLVGRRGNRVDAFRLELQDRFRVAADQYITKVPEAREFWNAVIKPEAF